MSHWIVIVGSYEHLDKITKKLINGILEAGRDAGHEVCGGSISGMFGFFFCKVCLQAFCRFRSVTRLSCGVVHGYVIFGVVCTVTPSPEICMHALFTQTNFLQPAPVDFPGSVGLEAC